MSDPPPDAVKNVVEILGISTPSAVNLLKRNNNDVARCMEAYFNDQVNSIKDVPTQLQWEPQDNVPFEDDSSTGAMPALSRPPSRVDNVGHGHGHNGRDIEDLSQNYAQATALVDQAAASKQQQDDMDDPDMRRAIEMSLGENSVQPQQETGITTSGSGQQFGPATRQDYNPNEWGMVSYGPVATSREIVDHPPPSKRRKKDGQPAFLRPSSATGYLAALLTIYHSIPLAREALLLPSIRVTEYGYDPVWWSGASDENGKHISIATEVGQYRDNNKLNLLAEVQCLMALLDNTQRAYASVDALSDLHILRSFQRTASTPFSAFLEAWRDAALSQQPEEPLTQIFMSEAKKTTEPGVEVTKEMVCVESQVIRRPDQTLVNLLDNVVWDDSPETLDDVWISHAGEVFTIRLFEGSSGRDGLSLTAPAIWYPDRYMAELREQTRQMRVEVQQVMKTIHAITAQQRRLESFMGPNRKPVRAREVLEAAAKASHDILQDRYASHRQNEELDGADVSGIEGHIRAVLARIDTKISELDKKKMVLQAQIDELELRYTEPGEDPSQPPRLKYFLQGVATKPEIMYIRKRTDETNDLLEPESDEEEEQHQRGSSEWQWWRIAWSSAPASQPGPTVLSAVEGPQPEATAAAEPLTAKFLADLDSDNSNNNHDDGSPYTISQVSEAAVIEAVRTEHHSVVLIYASQAAVDYNVRSNSSNDHETSSSGLSPALRKFIEQDNRNFATELHEELNPTSNYNNYSSKDAGLGSMDSGFASQQDLALAISDDDDHDEGLTERPQMGTTNTTTMTTTTVRASVDRDTTPMSWRNEDGQPSPKRPKSSDNNNPWGSGGGGSGGGGGGGAILDQNLMDASPPPYEESPAPTSGGVAAGGGGAGRGGYGFGFDGAADENDEKEGEGEGVRAAATGTMPEMQEKQPKNLSNLGHQHHQSKIGQYADAMLEKYGNGAGGGRGEGNRAGRGQEERFGFGDASVNTERPEAVHIERSPSLPR